MADRFWRFLGPLYKKAEKAPILSLSPLPSEPKKRNGGPISAKTNLRIGLKTGKNDVSNIIKSNCVAIFKSYVRLRLLKFDSQKLCRFCPKKCLFRYEVNVFDDIRKLFFVAGLVARLQCNWLFFEEPYHFVR